MGNNHSKWTNYFQAIQTKKVPLPNADQIDPYEVLGLSKNFTWDELKVSYRYIAKMVHPDKGGNEEMFQLVTHCFRVLAEDFKRRQGNKPHHVLKQESQQYYENTAPAPSAGAPNASAKASSVYGSGGNFNVDKFNTLFEENRFDDDEHQHGYGDMMEQSSKTREDITIARTIETFNKERFNEQFNKAPVHKATDVTIYKEPEPLEFTKKIAYTELGVTRINDYSSTVDDRRALQYTDYKKAHSYSRLIDPTEVDVAQKQYKNVKEYEKARAAALEKKETEEERRYRMERELKEKQLQEERQRTQKDRDERITQHFEKMSQLLIGTPTSTRSNRSTMSNRL